MVGRLPSVRVRLRATGQPIVINASDYDPSLYAPLDDPAPEAPPPPETIVRRGHGKPELEAPPHRGRGKRDG